MASIKDKMEAIKEHGTTVMLSPDPPKVAQAGKEKTEAPAVPKAGVEPPAPNAPAAKAAAQAGKKEPKAPASSKASQGSKTSVVATAEAATNDAVRIAELEVRDPWEITQAEKEEIEAYHNKTKKSSKAKKAAVSEPEPQEPEWDVFHPEYMDDSHVDSHSTAKEIDISKLSRDSNGILQFPTDALFRMEEHKFKVKYDDHMKELEAQIRNDGIKEPLQIWFDEKDHKYKLLSGNCRRFVAFRNRIPHVPVIITTGSRDDAIITMSTANNHREVSYMERLAACKDEYEARKRRGARNDLAGGKNEKALADLIGAKLGIQARQLQRQFHLLELVEPLQEWVNTGKLKKGVGMELSYLKPEEQNILWDGIEYETYKIPTPAQAVKLRALSQAGKFQNDEVLKIMVPGLDTRPRDPGEIFKSKKIPLLFPDGTSNAEMEDQLVTMYKEKQAQEQKKLLNIAKKMAADKESPAKTTSSPVNNKPLPALPPRKEDSNIVPIPIQSADKEEGDKKPKKKSKDPHILS